MSTPLDEFYAALELAEQKAWTVYHQEIKRIRSIHAVRFNALRLSVPVQMWTLKGTLIDIHGLEFDVHDKLVFFAKAKTHFSSMDELPLISLVQLCQRLERGQWELLNLDTLLDLIDKHHGL